MTTTGHQDRDFADRLIPGRDSLLADAIEWIKGNLAPDDVFDSRDLFEWAGENAANPEDVFSTHDLDSWAENNGYVPEC
jgi:hypothetical protein